MYMYIVNVNAWKYYIGNITCTSKLWNKKVHVDFNGYFSYTSFILIVITNGPIQTCTFCTTVYNFQMLDAT